MRIQQLKLVEFRNFANLNIQLQPNVNFIFGDNGQGKTNLIEAVYLASKGTSFRPVEVSSLINRGNLSAAQTQLNASHPSIEKQGHIRAIFRRADLQYEVDIVLQGARKQILLNEKRATSVDLARTIPTVLFSPESLATIKGGPEQRRLLMDELILIEDPNKARVIQEFEKCLKARNRLLRTIANGQGQAHENDLTLASLTKIFLILGTTLTSARIKALLNIRDDFTQAMNMICGEFTGDISVDYLISGQSAMLWSDREIYNALHTRSLALASQERSSGTSLVGPQKHDVKFLFDGNDSRFYCSQGQQRALILSFKIAQIVYHGRVHQTYPVLLLDDVLSELDIKKRGNLLKFLEAISAQILVTATDLSWPEQFAAEKTTVFVVRGGRVEPFASA